jgi:tetratricopeptide (TPR) repeat protein
MAAPMAEFDGIVQLLNEKKFGDAIPLLESQVKQTPDDVRAHFFLGVAYRMVNRLDDAIKSFTMAADLAGDVPEAGEIHLRRGIAWLHKGEYRIAHADFETAAGMIANDPRPELWKGIALVKQNKIRDSITAYSTALRYEPRYETALMNRGLAYLAIEEADMAVADFDEVIRINPESALAFHRRGVALGRQGDFAGAIESYTAAIRLDSKLAEAYFNRGLLLQRMGQSGRASADAAKARELEPQIQQRASTARVASRAS